MSAQAKAEQYDRLGDYLTRIGGTPLLNAEQEVELARRMRAGAHAARLAAAYGPDPELTALIADGDAARDHLIRANLRLVVAVAKRYAHRGMSLADVIQDGNLGLIRAVERYDPSRGYRLSTIAAWWIRKAIQQGIEHAHTVRLPIGLQDRLIAVTRAEIEATHLLGRAPTEAEVAARVGVESAKLAVLRRTPQDCVSLDLIVQDGQHAMTLGDMIEDPESALAEREVERAELRRVLAGLVARLAPRQALILRLRYGLDGYEPHTPRQIADKMGLTAHWVRQLEKDALTKLRRSLRHAWLR
ncbi:sigma-70 family RNA polymerase sigma factor [Nonomuraea sp. MCN248]|uniref:RNA polymerase sigma factor n=1 Tax=Nonomuraea corallina TaxID=2989783 RepID=A0ABT4SAY1_9ACTN|nr:sigma-70 family RNA polymerase sigma factor [Nonomuraea corallina]MDA0634218.1 sigma-70 family RNA polymerase sigma factor [Nonomuraea corallina]